MYEFQVKGDRQFVINADDARNIYDRITDSESRFIFTNRVMFSLTKDLVYIRNILRQNQKIADFAKKIASVKGKIAIFGAGSCGRSVTDLYDADWLCYIDNFSFGKEVNGLPVISFGEFKNNYYDENVYIMIGVMGSYDEVQNQIIESGIDAEKIINDKQLINNMIYNQYFDFPIYSQMFTSGKKASNCSLESFVDAGTYDGASSYAFAAWCRGNYSNIWAFEPDTRCFNYCKENIKLKNFNIINSGLSNKTETLCFSCDKGASGSARISEAGDMNIQVMDLDSVLGNEKVTFIKMDIEGAEYDALCGARGIIASQKPKLAICVYHRAEDIIEIPKLLLEINPDYKFAFRHYSIFNTETVLYAF